MQAPTWIERSTALKMIRENEMSVHQRKMASIGNTNQAVKEAKTITSQMRKNRQDRQKTKEFMTNEKNITINKDNQILLNKLVEISSGKWSSVVTVPKKAVAKRNQSVKNSAKGPISLNMIVRKRETERIEKENHAFAKRLFDKQAVLNKKGLDQDWRHHIQYKKQIAKMPHVPKTRIIVTSDMRRSNQDQIGMLQQAQEMMQNNMEPMQMQDNQMDDQ